MKLEDIVKITNAKVIGNLEKNIDVQISTDTRTIKKGDFYLPLKGASFDGEKFIEQAIEKGAIGSFCTEGSISINKSVDGEPIPLLLQVPDTLVAYLQLANYRRRQLDFTVVAITGSSGKTTTKEIVASTLGAKFKVFKTPLNHNNEVGFCQTIFATPEDTEVLVLEMGMRGLGEIELLSKYAEPDISIVSNVGTAHIGRLGSRENIAKAKCEIVKYQRGKTFIAHDDEIIKKTIDFNGEKVFYSINDVKVLEKRANYSKFEYLGNIYELNVGGNYNIENALSAVNVGIKLGLSISEIQQGLKNYRPIEKRWEAVNAGGFEIINDSYNANPESMRAFVDTIFELYEDYLLVLGDMGELGEKEESYHKELGEYIFKKNSKARVLTVGNLSENISRECDGKHFSDISQVVEYIKNNISKSTRIFLKASRSMKFENIISLLS
ncbi:MAG: UDP-N-acetylmuramoyl-tripeptide--D-alanyl-D-alanine ligase [Cyanobacteria bacterium SIG31]|nr:UDP-N-acetylmuramoyl-tripeptide--D-alanyl-D-alanine ligase [Cyanobacteria bacterium SIG31]